MFLKPSSEPLDLLTPEITVTGHQGSEWKLLYLSLQDIDEPFQVNRTFIGNTNAVA